MAIKNVLQYVQATLGTMDSDQVDTITDTAEATQVAELLADIYAELINRQEWEFLRLPASVTAGADPTQPTKFAIPANVRHVLKLWYNVSDDAVTRRELHYRSPEDFLLLTGNGAASSKQLVTTGDQIQFYVSNDRAPTYYTSFDGATIYCDSFKASIETTLQQSKVSCLAIVNPAFVVSDDFVPLLPEHMVPLLQASLNGAAHLYFKQQQSAVDEVRVRRQLAQARRGESKLVRETYYKNQFGRR